MKDDSRLSARFVRTLVAALRFEGRDADGLLRQAGIDPAIVHESAASLPLPAVLECWRLIESGPPHLGLRVSAGVDFGLLVRMESVTEYVLLQLLTTSPDIRTGLHLLQRYAPVTCGPFPYDLEEDDRGMSVRFGGPQVRSIPREFVNLSLAFPLRALLQTAMRCVTPLEVSLPYPAPASLQVHDRAFFGAPLHFDAAFAGFRLAKEDLAVRMQGASANLASRVCAHADAALSEIARFGPFVAETRALLRSMLHREKVSAAHIARCLGISVRQMERQLRDRGTSYRALLNEIRLDRAHELLADARYPVSEIARQVGFADASSLQRAFRRRFRRPVKSDGHRYPRPQREGARRASPADSGARGAARP